MTTSNLARRRDIAIAIGGPMALGALIASACGTRAMATGAFRLPAICFGVCALMAPALYIGAARVGLWRIGLPEIGDATWDALVRSGCIMLGALPVVAFLKLTCTTEFPTLLASPLFMGLGALIGLWHMDAKLFATPDAGGGTVVEVAGVRPERIRDVTERGRMLFAAWSLVTVAIGMSAYFKYFNFQDF